ncbi:hypothetical protein [Corynebacterium glyciniphilum]|uniref:hypothetical protein n=1 Tax=Corynebacterium glyciniphilum TaxID=1404244 RepID=UPI0026507534|nr:hypothetical protein [Corynebacterium glyciniphilum]MDN6704606.1 hypothetical protein [Corynebacterium glyciniphilum]
MTKTDALISNLTKRSGVDVSKETKLDDLALSSLDMVEVLIDSGVTEIGNAMDLLNFSGAQVSDLGDIN